MMNNVIGSEILKIFQYVYVIDVVNEIETLITKYNTKKIIFLDDNATVNKQRSNKS